MPKVVVGGQELFYLRRTGAEPGPALLFIHGAGGNALLWGRVLQAMPRRVEAVALDLPGHGRSAGPGQSTISAYGDAVLGAVAALELANGVLVGHSMGGAIALDVALHEPSWLRGLVVLSAAAHSMATPEFLQQLARHPALARQRIIDEGYGPATPQRERELAAKQLAEVDPEALRNDYAACSRFDARSRLTAIRCPALLLCGAEDRLIPPPSVRALRDGLPAATFKLVPGAGHMLPLERPAAVAEAILRFVDSLAQA